jgi:type IV pilus assembly protein PilY1
MKSKLVGLLLLSLCGFAQAITLERSPLFVRPPVDPNIVLTFDDSGSMGTGVTPNEAWYNYLPLGNAAGECGWRDLPNLYSSSANSQYFDPLVIYVPPVRADGTSFPAAVFTAAYQDGFAAYRVGGDLAASARNLATNYKPTMYYEPRADATLGNHSRVSFADVATTGNCSNGYFSPDPNERRAWVTNLPTDPRPTFQRAFYYTYIGVITPGVKPTTAELFGDAANSYRKAFYEPHLVSATEEQNFANWYSYYRTRNLMGRTAATVAFAQLPRNVRIAWQGINAPSVANSIIRKIEDNTQRDNFYSYLHNVLAPGGTPTRGATVRAGNYFSDAGENGFNEANPYYDITIANTIGNLSAPASLVSCRQNYHMIFTDGGWNSEGGAYEGQNFDQTAVTLPGTYNETTNTTPAGPAFPSAITTGLLNPTFPYSTVYTNGPNQANKGGYADLSFDYWRRDLKTNLKNNVQPFIDDKSTGVTGNAVATLPANPLNVPEIYWNPKNDPAAWQHVVQYVVAFGLTSSLDFPNDLNGLRNGSKIWSQWDNNENSDPREKVDDTWHATLNSRGELLAASNPQELVAQMNTVFQAIAARTASVSAISVSSSFLTAGTLSFRTYFKTSSWSGSVQAERFLATGAKEIAWDAACRLDGGPCLTMAGNPSFVAPNPTTGRKIYSSNGTSAIDFTWAALSTAQRDALNFNWDLNVADAQGSARVDFLRGVRGLEGAIFRSRESVLGAVVNSNAVYVSGPVDEYWSKDELENQANRPKFPTDAAGGDLTSAPETKTNFRAHFDAVLGRAPTIYAGSNDGMLHAFNATTGEETWAYLPYTGFKELSRLTSKSKLFTQSSVDSTPVVREVYTGTSWKTMLVGAMRLGGQGIFALNVTNPTAGTAAQKFLWEFRDTSVGGEDLGYTYGRPAITRLKYSKKWVVLLPGGYNSNETVLPVPLPVVTDGAVGSGNAVLFVLDAADGTVIQKIDLGAGTSGLSSVVAGDYIFDDASAPAGTRKKYLSRGTNAKFNYYNDEVTDVAFAGDDSGGLWRFNLEDSLPANWTAVKAFQAPANQRITAQPRIVDPKGNGLAKVVFGTGRFVAKLDRTDTNQQAVYGIFDPGPNYAGYPLTQTQLENKPVTATAGVGKKLVSVSSAAIPIGKLGWWFNLPFTGDRVIAGAGLLSASNRVIVASFTPIKDTLAANDPCVENSESTLYVFNPDTGGPSGASIDTNGDGFVNSADDAGVSGYTTPGYVGAVTPVTYAGGGSLGLLVPDPPGTPQPAAVPYCTTNPTDVKCVACAADPTSEVCKCLRDANCPGGGLPTFIWRKTTTREIPAWDNNDL